MKKIVFEPQVHPFHIDFMRHVSNIVYVEWMEFRFHNGAGELVATGRQRGLFVEIATGRPKRIDPNLRQRFEEYLIVEPRKSVE